MASSSVNQSYAEQFSREVYILSQQKGSRLRDCVAQKPFTAGESAYFERIDKIAAVQRTSQHQDTNLTEVPHSRRRCVFTDWELGSLFDLEDQLRMIIDPRQPYQDMHAYAMGRAMDDAIISAMGGNALSGQTGATTVALPSAQLVAAGGTGLTLAKLLSAKQILDTADVDPMEPRYAAVEAQQIIDLLNTTEIKSADYNTVKALAEGTVDSFLGFKFIRTELVMTNSLGVSLLDGSGNTLCYFWAQRGVGMIIPRDVTASIDKRPDKGNSWQVLTKASFGATRIEDAKVVQVACAQV